MVWPRLSSLLAASTLVVLLAGCSGDTLDDTVSPNPVPEVPDAGPGDFRLQAAAVSPVLVEGGDPVRVPITLTRGEGFTGEVTLSAEAANPVTPATLSLSFDDATLDAGDADGTLLASLAIGMTPLGQDETREIIVTGRDTQGRSSETRIDLEVTPTDRPDVYLLAGQSNMVGFSGSGTREAALGEIDAPQDGIFQLNVTPNDREVFSEPGTFTDPDLIARASPRYVIASHPLHVPADAAGTVKEGDYIGLGLEFAKTAKNDTTAEIYLVPAAWSDSGFCRRDALLFPAAMGWLPESATSPRFGGTRLYDRALARLSATLEETGGILRGILWHQGEADSSDPVCAEAYAGNLVAMVEAFRRDIPVDARGESARGSEAAVPFVLGTMSKGGTLANFGDSKQVVDGVHRTIDTLIPWAAWVNADDLVPPAYACGEPDCIHFGAAAYREMGRRYAAALGDARAATP